MRPNRTLPLALWLALLAALSGCVGEGELEPDYGTLVDGLVDEVESGLLAGGGNPLADGGDPLAYDFRCWTCEDDHECVDACLEHGPRIDGSGWYVCDCGAPLGGRRYCEIHGPFLTGGGNGDDLIETVGGLEPGPDDGDPAIGEGGGSDPNRRRAARLKCSDRPTRGTEAGCEIETKLPVDSMVVNWMAGGQHREGEGANYMEWRGKARTTWSGGGRRRTTSDSS